MLQIHPDPILSPSVVKNALVDSIRFFISRFSTFPIFLFSSSALVDLNLKLTP